MSYSYFKCPSLYVFKANSVLALYCIGFSYFKAFADYMQSGTIPYIAAYTTLF